MAQRESFSLFSGFLYRLPFWRGGFFFGGSVVATNCRVNTIYSFAVVADVFGDYRFGIWGGFRGSDCSVVSDFDLAS